MTTLKFNLKTTVSTDNSPVSRANVTRANITKTANEISEREARQYTSQSKVINVKRNDREKVTLDTDQINALRLLATQQFACVSGPAGTGKTTIMAQALELLEQQVIKIDFNHARSGGRFPDASSPRKPSIGMACATNVAAQNLAAKLDPKWAGHCMSIHALLCFVPVMDDDGRPTGIFEPLYHAGNKLPYDICIVDEAGIMALNLWKDFYAACAPTTRVYFLGDLFQLEPVQGASPMPFAMDKWPTAYLSKIYRQADGSPIITEAHNIRKGLHPRHHKGKVIMGQKETLPKRVNEAQKHVLMYIRAMFKSKLFDPVQDIIITPENKGMLGQETINQAFRLAFNPPKKDENGVTLNPPIMIRTAEGSIDFMVGDKVMSTSNGGRLATERRFNNGSIGVITAIYPNPKYKGDISLVGQMHVSELNNDDDEDMLDIMNEGSKTTSLDGLSNDNYDDDDFFNEVLEQDDDPDPEKARRAASHIVEVTETSTGEKYILERSAEIANLRHAYAVTCHKFQGSQARRVMIITHQSSHASMLSREWLYTAFTRAQEAVIYLHDEASLMRCITRQSIYGKDAKQKAENMVKKYTKTKAWRIPDLQDATPFVATPAILNQLKGYEKDG